MKKVFKTIVYVALAIFVVLALWMGRGLYYQFVDPMPSSAAPAPQYTQCLSDADCIAVVAENPMMQMTQPDEKVFTFSMCMNSRYAGAGKKIDRDFTRVLEIDTNRTCSCVPDSDSLVSYCQ